MKRMPPAKQKRLEAAGWRVGSAAAFLGPAGMKRAPTHPGEMLRLELLEPLKLSQRELAQRLGVSQGRVRALVLGASPVTAEMALRLERLFGMSAQFWLNLQAATDLYAAAHSRAGKSIRKVKALPALEALAFDEVLEKVPDAPPAAGDELPPNSKSIRRRIRAQTIGTSEPPDPDDPLLGRITRTPGVMGGFACIRRSRVTVGLVLVLLAAGRSHAEILAAYPYLEADDIKAALRYAVLLCHEKDEADADRP